MSSACDGDAIANSPTRRRRLRNRQTGTFVIHVASSHRSHNLILERASKDAATICCREGSETGAFASQKDRLRRLSGGKIAPKPAKVTVCLATHCIIFPIENRSRPDLASSWFRRSLYLSYGKMRHAGTQACRTCTRDMLRSSRTMRLARPCRCASLSQDGFPCVRKRTARERHRPNFGRRPCPPDTIGRRSCRRQDRIVLASIISATRAEPSSKPDQIFD